MQGRSDVHSRRIATGGRRGGNADDIDNDNDGCTDETGEKDWDLDNWLVAIYPEVGVHAWLNGRCRLTAYGRYLVTTEGRVHDDWLMGGQITVFRR